MWPPRSLMYMRRCVAWWANANIQISIAKRKPIVDVKQRICGRKTVEQLTRQPSSWLNIRLTADEYLYKHYWELFHLNKDFLALMFRLLSEFPNNHSVGKRWRPGFIYTISHGQTIQGKSEARVKGGLLINSLNDISYNVLIFQNLKEKMLFLWPWDEIFPFRLGKTPQYRGGHVFFCYIFLNTSRLWYNSAYLNGKDELIVIRLTTTDDNTIFQHLLFSMAKAVVHLWFLH